MNEKAAVMNYKIVPNDTRAYIRQLLEEIENTPGRKVQTKCIYTDNPRVDTSICEKVYQELSSYKVIPDVLQVIY
jgi:hypothetical protein